MSTKQYRICIDLDGTLCENKVEGETYLDVLPKPGAVAAVQAWKFAGHYIIIYSARNMVTHNNNLGRIIAHQSPIVVEWLKKHQIPYDELWFGKPLADFYIDDKAIEFTTWKQTTTKINTTHE